MKNSQVRPQVRPLMKVRIVSQGIFAYAWLGANMMIDDWATEMISPTLRGNADDRRQAVVSACAKAFRQLQRRHPDKDLVVSVEEIEGLPSLPWELHLPQSMVAMTGGKLNSPGNNVSY